MNAIPPSSQILPQGHLVPDPIGQLEPLGVPFRRFVQVLRRRWWILALCLVLGISGAAYGILKLQPHFTSEALILVEPRRSAVSGLQVPSTDAPDQATVVQTQIDILRSPALLRRVIDALDLSALPEFSPSNRSLVEIASQYLRFLSGNAPSDEFLRPEARILIAAGILSKKVTLTSELRSSVITVRVETTSGELSTGIANTIANQYLEFHRDRKYQTLQRALDWFRIRLTELSEQLSVSQNAVQVYREQHGLADMPFSRGETGVDGLSLKGRQLANISQRLADVSSTRTQLEAQFAELATTLRAQGRAANMPEVPPNRMSELNAMRATESALRQTLVQVRQEVAEENAARSQMEGLLAQAQASRTMYDSFLARAAQLANTDKIQEADAELVSAATLPIGPSSPKRAQLLGIAIGFSLLIGSAVAFLTERLRSGISTSQEVEGKLGLNLLATLPKMRIASATLASWQAEPEVLAALGRIRGSLHLVDRERRPKLLAVSSSLPGEGKTALAIGLAESAASAGWRTLLVDCNMHDPAIAQILQIRAAYTLEQLLDGSATTASATINRPSGLHIIASEVSRADPQELIGSQKMRNLLQEWRSQYDLVILNTPPVLPVADALILGQVTDAVLFAVCWESTSLTLVQEAVRMLRSAGVCILGAVLTQVNMHVYAQNNSGYGFRMRRQLRRYYRPST